MKKFALISRISICNDQLFYDSKNNFHGKVFYAKTAPDGSLHS